MLNVTGHKLYTLTSLKPNERAYSQFSNRFLCPSFFIFHFFFSGKKIIQFQKRKEHRMPDRYSSTQVHNSSAFRVLLFCCYCVIFEWKNLYHFIHFECKFEYKSAKQPLTQNQQYQCIHFTFTNGKTVVNGKCTNVKNPVGKITMTFIPV